MDWASKQKLERSSQWADILNSVSDFSNRLAGMSSLKVKSEGRGRGRKNRNGNEVATGKIEDEYGLVAPLHDTN